MSVCIPINDQYRLTTDSLQWIVQKHGGHRPNGEIRWDSIGYYVSPAHAINGLYKFMLRECDADTLISLQNTAESLATALLRAYTTATEVSADIVSKEVA